MKAAARKPWALAMALVLVLAWGGNYSVQKALLAQIGPQAMILVRYLVTPACALAVLLWRHGLAWPRLERGEWAALAGPRTQGVGDLLLLVATILFASHTVAAKGVIDRQGVLRVMAYSTRQPQST